VLHNDRLAHARIPLYPQEASRRIDPGLVPLITEQPLAGIVSSMYFVESLFLFRKRQRSNASLVKLVLSLQLSLLKHTKILFGKVHGC
jgi:hypothetical protein